MSGTAKRALWATIAAVVVCVAIGLYVGLYLINVPGSVAAAQTLPDRICTWRRSPLRSERPAPHLGVVLRGQRQFERLAPQHDVRRSREHAGARDDLPVRHGDRDCATHSSRSRPEPSGRWINGKPSAWSTQPRPGTRSRSRRSAYRCRSRGSGNAKNLCANAPCSLSEAHVTVSFTFRTPPKGLYRWQCFVPCAAGFIQGNGGPMQTVGYMGGFLKVV